MYEYNSLRSHTQIRVRVCAHTHTRMRTCFATIGCVLASLSCNRDKIVTWAVLEPCMVGKSKLKPSEGIDPSF